MKEFKQLSPNAYVEMIHNFQTAKHEFDFENCKKHNCRLPDDFLQFLDAKCQEKEGINEDEEIFPDDIVNAAQIMDQNKFKICYLFSFL